jgi:hypothetical protein
VVSNDRNVPQRFGNIFLLRCPATTFGDGLYLVGVDVTPGEYKTSGPGAGGHCYWARLSDSSGADIIANNITEGPTRVTAIQGEYLEISGCTFVTA